jgi:DNA helicase-2/ATP-dependent DNA helicase PcrA
MIVEDSQADILRAAAIDGNKLTIAFDRAGKKRVVDSFVERV